LPEVLASPGEGFETPQSPFRQFLFSINYHKRLLILEF